MEVPEVLTAASYPLTQTKEMISCFEFPCQLFIFCKFSSLYIITRTDSTATEATTTTASPETSTSTDKDVTQTMPTTAKEGRIIMLYVEAKIIFPFLADLEKVSFSDLSPESLQAFSGSIGLHKLLSKSIIISNTLLVFSLRIIS